MQRPRRAQPAPQRRSAPRLDAKRAALNSLPIDRYPRIREAADDMLHCDDPDAYYESGIALYVEGARSMLQLATADRR